jgi:phage tail sheath protein FI
MSTVLSYPGVYIEELASGQHTITGVATSIGAFIGWAPQGSVTEPGLVESWAEYQTAYGGWDARSYLGYAVNQFFSNGGTQAYIVRLVADNALTASGTVNGLPLWASSPGAWGNYLSVTVTQPVSSSPGVGLTLTISSTANGTNTLLESYSNLSLLPTSSQYVVTVINNDSSYVTFVDAANPSAVPQVPASAVTLTAAASGSPTPTVQWQVSTDGGTTWQNIPGATSTTYTFGAGQTATGNEYRAVFTNSAGVATSGAATLTLTGAQAPAISANPANQSVALGTVATFNANANGNPTPTVQWQVSNDGGTTFTNIPGATGLSYVVTATVALNNAEYQAVFTNSQGTATTTAATLTVTTAAAAPTVITQPTSQSVAAGQTVTFTAAASGSPTPTVVWNVSTGGGPYTSTGVTTPTLSFVATAAMNNNEYEAAFTNSGGGPVTSNPATLTVVAASAPVVTASPANMTVAAGGTGNFTANATGSPSPTVQWQVSTNGGLTYTPIPGATSTTYTVAAPTAAQNGYDYQAVFTNSQGTVPSAKATLTVNSTPAAPIVTTSPTNQTLSVGAPAGTVTATLSTGASDTVSDGDILDPTDAINPGEFTTALIPTGSPPPQTGYLLLEQVPIFNLLCVPAYSNAAQINTLLQYCSLRRAFMLVDPPQTLTPALLAKSQTPLDGTSSPFSGQYLTNAAYYFPWISVPDPLFGGRAKPCPPCGAVAGIYASTDADRGVWKAPAGTGAGIGGLLGLQFTLSDSQNGNLNPFAINCLRQFTSFGDVVWGARTMAGADIVGSQWKYVPVRRLALFLESSLYDGTQWVVFEPNDETLWGQIRLNVGTFMQGLFLQGAFAGTTPQQAYFVKCDAENNPESSTALGIVNILVGFAPLYPAEFVVIQIQQMTSQS